MMLVSPPWLTWVLDVNLNVVARSQLWGAVNPQAMAAYAKKVKRRNAKIAHRFKGGGRFGIYRGADVWNDVGAAWG
jgi:hypothetical protein